MTNVLSTNITSPLGFTTEQNYRAVRSGTSALKRYFPGEGMALPWGLTEPFAASLFSEEQKAALAIDGYTFFEAITVHSIREALSHTHIDVASPRVAFILSTTKGNVELLDTPCMAERYYPSEAARIIARAVGVTTTPIVVCNACVSGLSAQLLAHRLLAAGHYDHAIVSGADTIGKFIIAGFQSLKAVSAEPCRPFDIERNGLNPGEAAATIVLSRAESLPPRGDVWRLAAGASQCDAYHIVSPSPQGDGLTRAILATMSGRDKSQLATVCAHGTATLYNDQMESKAIQQAGLSDVPLSALKGYYGHTMGAAGVLETILTMQTTGDGIVLPVKGFTEPGVSGKVSITDKPRTTDKTAFLKLMSGFGGCNVAALYSKKASVSPAQPPSVSPEGERPKASLREGLVAAISSKEGKSLTDIYKQEIADSLKPPSSGSRFYKMDILSRLAFVTAERLKDESLPIEGEVWRGSSLILFNHSSSIVSDRRFLKTISDKEGCFPSPSAFVYTLPNIAAAEIAIRHHIHAETAFYILPERDEALMQQIVEATLQASGQRSAISGWIDAESETHYECELSTYNTHINTWNNSSTT